MEGKHDGEASMKFANIAFDRDAGDLKPELVVADWARATAHARLIGDGKRYRDLWHRGFLRFAPNADAWDAFAITMTASPEIIVKLNETVGLLLNKDHGLTKLARARLAFTGGSSSDYEQALRLYEEFEEKELEADPQLKAVMQFGAAMAHYRLNRPNQAEKMYKRGCETLKHETRRAELEHVFRWGFPWFLSHLARQEAEEVMGRPIQTIDSFQKSTECSEDE